MFFLIPAAAALTVTIGEFVGLGFAAIGIGTGIKGAVDYRRAKQLREEANKQYQLISSRTRRKLERLKKSSNLMAA